MIKIFKSKKNKAIQSYLKVLPSCMAKDYGKSFEYTPMQVLKSIERYKLNAKYESYALILFCTKEDCLDYMLSIEDNIDYQEINDELSTRFFEGHSFNTSDVAKYSLTFSNYGGDTSVHEWIGGSDGDGDGD